MDKTLSEMIQEMCRLQFEAGRLAMQIERMYEMNSVMKEMGEDLQIPMVETAAPEMTSLRPELSVPAPKYPLSSHAKGVSPLLQMALPVLVESRSPLSLREIAEIIAKQHGIIVNTESLRHSLQRAGEKGHLHRIQPGMSSEPLKYVAVINGSEVFQAQETQQ